MREEVGGLKIRNDLPATRKGKCGTTDSYQPWGQSTRVIASAKSKWPPLPACSEKGNTARVACAYTSLASTYPNNSSSSITICHRIQIIMMASSMQEPDRIPTDFSRPPKRRRFYRKRTNTEEDDDPHVSAAQSVIVPDVQTIDELVAQNGHTTKSPTQSEEAPLSVAELIRQRKAIQRRRGGIEFTNLNPATSTIAVTQPSDALAEKDDTPADIKLVIGRFAPQTGQVSEATDKHMYVWPPLLPTATRRSD